MRIGLVTSDPDHPLLAGAIAVLTPDHEIQWLNPAQVDAKDRPETLADVYLLKARTPRALGLARELERRGAPVLNSACATELCQDRTAMADLARWSGLPFVATRTVAALRDLPAEPDLPYPLVVKSRYSRRGDLVARVEDVGRLRELALEWGEETVVVQPFVANSGWDSKFWVIDGQVFAALRRSELAPAQPPGGTPVAALTLEGVPEDWRDAVLTVGKVFALDVYGVDVIDTGGGVPGIVDINAFPGARGQAGASEALAALALRTAKGVGHTG